MRFIRRLLLIVLGVGAAIALSGVFTSVHAVDQVAQRSPDIDAESRVSDIEQTWKRQYEYHLGARLATSSLTADQIATTLERLSSQTGQRLALVYVFPHPEDLELVLIIPGRDPVRKTFPTVTKAKVDQVVRELQSLVTRPVGGRRYLAPAKQLYDWIIAPLEADLAAQPIDALVFCMGAGLRSLPIAVLSDGEQFLIEKYSVGIIPAFNLTNLNHQDLRQTQVLAMGASEFEDLGDLPAVPFELNAIAQNLWSGEVFLNQDFTLENLRRQLESDQFRIVHLATHAEFRPGTPNNSFIQLWEGDRLRLDQVRRFNWSELPVELLVLSACETALGNEQAELGFAGLTYHAGVKSSLASLWRVSDVGTLALMREFYAQLANPDVTTKVEALRRAQRSLLTGQVRIRDGQLEGSAGSMPLPPELAENRNVDFSIPYYWAAFMLVGSPW